MTDKENSVFLLADYGEGCAENIFGRLLDAAMPWVHRSTLEVKEGPWEEYPDMRELRLIREGKAISVGSEKGTIVSVYGPKQDIEAVVKLITDLRQQNTIITRLMVLDTDLRRHRKAIAKIREATSYEKLSSGI